jgi:hypothetical protein
MAAERDLKFGMPWDGAGEGQSSYPFRILVLAELMARDPTTGESPVGESSRRIDRDNFDDVLAQLRDAERLDAMVERAYEEVIASGAYSFEAFVRGFDADISRLWKALPTARRRSGVAPGAPGVLERVGFLRVRASAAVVRTVDPLNRVGQEGIHAVRVALAVIWAAMSAVSSRFAAGRVIRPLRNSRVRAMVRTVIRDEALPRRDCLLTVLKVGDWPARTDVEFHVRLQPGEVVRGEVDATAVRDLVKRKNVREIYLVSAQGEAPKPRITESAFPLLLLEHHADEVAELVYESLEASSGPLIVDA